MVFQEQENETLRRITQYRALSLRVLEATKQLLPLASITELLVEDFHCMALIFKN